MSKTDQLNQEYQEPRITAKEAVELAQKVGMFASLMILLGRAEKYKEQHKGEFLVQITLPDAKKTTAAMAVPIDAIRDELIQLQEELTDEGVATSDMVKEIDDMIEAEFSAVNKAH